MGSINVGEVVEDPTGGQIQAYDLAGPDPDIRGHALPRDEGWRGIFGQAGASQTHLENQGIGPRDLSLFFGRFRQVEKTANGCRFERGAPRQHIIWGWLQIGESIQATSLFFNRRSSSTFVIDLLKPCEGCAAVGSLPLFSMGNRRLRRDFPWTTPVPSPG